VNFDRIESGPEGACFRAALEQLAHAFDERAVDIAKTRGAPDVASLVKIFAAPRVRNSG